MDNDFPADDNGDALRRLLSDGDDFTRMRGVDFTVVFASNEAAELFAEHFRRGGCKVSVEETCCVAAVPWDVVVTREMLPSAEAITAFETELEEVANGFGGRNDGWGCFAQKE